MIWKYSTKCDYSVKCIALCSVALLMQICSIFWFEVYWQHSSNSSRRPARPSQMLRICFSEFFNPPKTVCKNIHLLCYEVAYSVDFQRTYTYIHIKKLTHLHWLTVFTDMVKIAARQRFINDKRLRCKLWHILSTLVCFFNVS